MAKVWREDDLRALNSDTCRIPSDLGHISIMGVAPTEEERVSLEQALAKYEYFDGYKVEIRASERDDAKPGELDLVLSWEELLKPPDDSC